MKKSATELKSHAYAGFLFQNRFVKIAGTRRATENKVEDANNKAHLKTGIFCIKYIHNFAIKFYFLYQLYNSTQINKEAFLCHGQS